MFSKFFGFIAKLFGRNYSFTPKGTIMNQMEEKRPLPLGVIEFMTWSDRIISGTMLTADADSQRFALANMLMHLGPTVDHECDAYFIKSLRKYAVNQVADEVRHRLHEAAKTRLAAEEAAVKKSNTPLTQSEDTPQYGVATGNVEKVLGK